MSIRNDFYSNIVQQVTGFVQSMHTRICAIRVCKSVLLIYGSCTVFSNNDSMNSIYYYGGNHSCLYHSDLRLCYLLPSFVDGSIKSAV